MPQPPPPATAPTTCQGMVTSPSRSHCCAGRVSKTGSASGCRPTGARATMTTSLRRLLPPSLAAKHLLSSGWGPPKVVYRRVARGEGDGRVGWGRGALAPVLVLEHDDRLRVRRAPPLRRLVRRELHLEEHHRSRVERGFLGLRVVHGLDAHRLVGVAEVVAAVVAELAQLRQGKLGCLGHERGVDLHLRPPIPLTDRRPREAQQQRRDGPHPTVG
mmetsp:Transcript_20242/g.64385  ORF Transcript_20242/g.64385 Transcript_20242/m.64385 type:complete len:216 (+) Transcript_20242:1312-1959(+)